MNMHHSHAGDGHFSPVGGYHSEQDMVLILDTARFKYPPHWVPLKRLYQAMAHVDSATGQPRGYLNIRANPQLESVMFTLNRPNRCALFLGTSLVAGVVLHYGQSFSSTQQHDSCNL